MKRLAPLILLLSAILASDQLPLRASGPSIRVASEFPGADVGQQINAGHCPITEARSLLLRVVPSLLRSSSGPRINPSY
jgi:hypothetical protein